MRRAKEASVWAELRLNHARVSPDPIEITLGSSALDLSQPCTVLGGRNGSGKSRLLRSIDANPGYDSLYLDLHHLCEQAFIVLRDREKHLSEMKNDSGALDVADERLSDVGRVIGRDYGSVKWYALDLVPSDKEVAKRFLWGGEEPITPYFEATYAGVEYNALQMGLGEFSVHFLFWILEQYRDRKDLILLLDEPDAFLPPIGVESLLTRLLALCQKRNWKMVISTHSEEMIASAVDHESFLLLRMSEEGSSEGFHSVENRNVAETLLSRPPIERVLFVEDESAWYLCRALLEIADPRMARRTSTVWVRGEGHLEPIRQHILKSPTPQIQFAVVPDGDQRSKKSDKPVEGQWPLQFLPTTQDPDALFRTLKEDVGSLAANLGIEVSRLQRFLDDLEGEDDHDWVNRFGAEYGRSHTLTVLAASWASAHRDEADAFAARIRTGE